MNQINNDILLKEVIFQRKQQYLVFGWCTSAPTIITCYEKASGD